MGRAHGGKNREKSRWKDRLKGVIRRMLEAKYGVRNFATNGLLFGLKTLGRLPLFGGFGNRWAGFIHAIRSEHPQAIAMYRKVIVGESGATPSLRYDLGMSLLKVGQARDAEQEFRAAIQALPGRPWLVLALTQALQDQGLAERVVPDLLKMAKSMPEECVPEIPFPTYLAHLVSEDPAQVSELNDLVRKHPNAIFATLLLAKVQALRRDGATSASLFRSAGRIRFGGIEDSSAKGTNPRFLILGQAKAGTSALFQYLSEHPDMVPPLVKEPQYWSQNFNLGQEWYESLFPRLAEGDRRFTGEGSVTYLLDPNAPKRVFEVMPSVKLIVLLRDPVSRAYSEYWMNRRVGRTNETFQEAVTRELQGVPVCPLDPPDEGERQIPLGYLVRSAALPFLKRWMRQFPREQMLVLRNEDMAGDLSGTLRKVCQFLDVSPFVVLDPKRHNEGRYVPISEELRSRLIDWFAPHEAALKTYLVEHFGAGTTG